MSRMNRVNPKPQRFTGWLLLFSLLLPLLCWAQNPTDGLRIDPMAERVDLSDRLTLFHDPEGQFNVNTVSKHQADFKPVKHNDLIYSFDAGIFWLRLELSNPTEREWMRWLVVGYPRMQNVEVFIPSEDGLAWDHMQAGARVPREKKPIKATDAVFPITLYAGQNLPILIRVESKTSIDMATSLWIPEAYRRVSGERGLLNVLVMGGVLLGAFLSLVVFFNQREKPYLWLGLLQISVVLLEATREGFLATYFWPADLPFYGAILLGFAALSLFSMASLVLTSLPFGLLPWHSERILLTFKWGAVVGLVIGLINYGIGIRLLSLSVILLMPISLIISTLVYRKGFLHARFLTYGLALTWAIETLRQLANLGIVAIPWAMHINTSTGLLFATPLILTGLVSRTGELAEQLVLSHKLSHAKTEFLARVSHELRSPLNTIIGFSRMLKRGSSRITLKEGTEGIEQNGVRLLGMIDELLDESRLRAGKLSLKPAPLAFRHWCSMLHHHWQINTNMVGNRFTSPLSSSMLDNLPAGILVDGDRLRQVLDNLLSNANRHTESGDISLAIQTETDEQAQSVRLTFSVSDTGMGIAPEMLDQIFEPFVRGEPAKTSDQGRRAGFGMGLSITRELLHLMGSEIFVTSEVAKGTTFRFTLSCPLTAPPAVDTSEKVPFGETWDAPASIMPLAVAEGPSCHSPLKNLRVLIVDDDPNACIALEDQLESLGCQTEVAQSGDEAIRLIQENLSWDVILTDQRMPNGDGWELLAFVRKTFPELPVVLLSAEIALPPEHLPPTVQFDQCLVKPVRTGQLCAALSSIRVKCPHPASATETLGTVETFQDQLNPLLTLVAGGEVTGIDEWCARSRLHWPEALSVINEIQAANNALDFARIVEMATTAAKTEPQTEPKIPS